MSFFEVFASFTAKKVCPLQLSLSAFGRSLMMIMGVNAQPVFESAGVNESSSPTGDTMFPVLTWKVHKKTKE